MTPTTTNVARIENSVRSAGVYASADDDRDIVFVPRVAPTASLAGQFGIFPRIEDQGHEGVCTGETATTIAEAIMNYGGMHIPGNGQLAPQFNYWYSRQYDSLVGDVGATPRSMCRSMKNYGICTDDLWPLSRSVYDAPSAAAQSEAATRKGCQYEVIVWNKDDPEDLARQVDAAIAEGLIVALAFYCRRWMFYVNGPLGSIGHMPPAMPSGNTGMHEIVGGHIVPIRGYDRSLHPASSGAYIVQNSWGTGWGDGGLWSLNRQALIEPGFAMEVRVIRGFAGITLAAPPPMPLTVAEINAARAKLATLGLGSVDTYGGFTFSPIADVPHFAAFRALIGIQSGMTTAQMSQVVGVPTSVIDKFLADNAERSGAWLHI